jgi:hypothetical protein
MNAVAENRIRYCYLHWIDLAIVLLPLIEALPILRLLRLGSLLRVEQVARLGRLYRLQALAMKGWRAMLVLEVVQRLTGRSLEHRLKRLEELLLLKEEETAELRREIEELRALVAARTQPAPASEPPPVPTAEPQPAAPGPTG